jgi:MORN repeat variant
MIGSAKPRKRPWWRLLTQFSLRSLLVLTTLAAIGCWWFLRPESRDEELAGGHLKLRRQVRMERVRQGFEEHPLLRSIGSWCVRDQYGDLLIDGQYKDDLPHGQWTIDYANGRKAAQGQVFCGARTGVWRTWDEEGTLRSEATYKVVLRTERQEPAMRPFISPWGIPVIGMIDLLGQFGGGAMGGGLGGGGPVTAPLPLWESKYVAVRHGPAKTWYAGGQIQLDGSYRNDLRDGPWTRFDEQGQIVEQGTYHAGVREGIWRTVQPAEPRSSQRRYVAGLPEDQRSQLLARLEGNLAGGTINRKIAAAERLETLGPAGAACLVKALESDDLETQLLAIRSLSRQDSLAEDALAKIAPLADHQEPRIALRARLALYRAHPAERERLLPEIFAALESADDPLAIETLLAIYKADPERRQIVLAPLVERMARAQPLSSGQIADFGWDVVPQLDAIYASSSPEGRWFAVRVLHNLVSRGWPQLLETSSGVREFRREIPASGQSLLQRAKADRDPRVQAAVQLVEQQSNQPGLGGSTRFGGQSGGFF